MKKVLTILAAALLLAGCLIGCGAQKKTTDTDRLQIVTTIFPEYDWVMNILGQNPAQAEVTLLLDSGVDLHSFQPTAEDILRISTCDLFIYVGGESDEWVEDALQQTENGDRIVLNLLDLLGDAVKEEEVIEGMQAEEEPEEEETEYDEHVWLSLQNASVLVRAIGDALCTVDPAHAGEYAGNVEAYVQKLNALDGAYREAVDRARQKTLLFADRFPFRYLVEDYGLSYYAAFVGCSAETEASFETIAFLSQKVDELGLGVVLTIEGANHRIAQTVVENTRTQDQRILVMDSLQSVTGEDAQSGVTYLSLMEQNLAVLQDALQ